MLMQVRRDTFMTGAVFGRTCARSLIAAGICQTSACSVAFHAYVTMHLDVLLDAVLEGTFSAVRVTHHTCDGSRIGSHEWTHITGMAVRVLGITACWLVRYGLAFMVVRRTRRGRAVASA